MTKNIQKQIEERLKAEKEALAKLSDEEVRELVCNLQLRQIELEMQNDELAKKVEEQKSALQNAYDEIEKKVEERTEELTKSLEEANNANLAKNKCLSNLSHEIRSPMQVIVGVIALLSESNLTQEQEEFLEIISRTSENLLLLINDMLDLSKIESASFELDEHSFDLKEILKNIGNCIPSRMINNNVELNIEIDKEVPLQLIGDSLRLHQILTNLLINAFKFTPQGTITLQVKSKNNIEDNEKCLVEFSVSDTGAGIAEDQQEMIWDRFVQAKGMKKRKNGGVGLGLAICKKLSEKMGGQIRLESKPGKGSTFYVTIPFYCIKETEYMAEEKKAIQPESIPFSNVLIVEDSKDLQRLMKSFMNKTECCFDIADNGEMGVEKYMSGTYDIIFMDVQMPYMDGLEATRRIRQWEKDKNKEPTPVIAFTAHSFRSDIQKCFDAGFTNVLAKPVARNIFYKTLHDFTTGQGYDLSYKTERRKKFRN